MLQAAVPDTFYKTQVRLCADLLTQRPVLSSAGANAVMLSAWNNNCNVGDANIYSISDFRFSSSGTAATSEIREITHDCVPKWGGRAEAELLGRHDGM